MRFFRIQSSIFFNKKYFGPPLRQIFWKENPPSWNIKFRGKNHVFLFVCIKHSKITIPVKKLLPDLNWLRIGEKSPTFQVKMGSKCTKCRGKFPVKLEPCAQCIGQPRYVLCNARLFLQTKFKLVFSSIKTSFMGHKISFWTQFTVIWTMKRNIKKDMGPTPWNKAKY